MNNLHMILYIMLAMITGDVTAITFLIFKNKLTQVTREGTLVLVLEGTILPAFSNINSQYKKMFT